MITPQPARGEIWYTQLEPARGHEQAEPRPALVLSRDIFNRGPAGLVVILPITKQHRGIPAHVLVEPPEGGVRFPSVILCDHIRSVAKERLQECWGAVSAETMAAVEEQLRILLGWS